MFPRAIALAHAFTGMVAITTPQAVANVTPAAELPSDSMNRVIHAITLSNFSVISGPEFERVLQGALLRSTEHLYDL
jgi:hypothetical protein